MTAGFVARQGGDPVKGLGCFQIVCGICPCITSIICIIVWMLMMLGAAAYTSNVNDTPLVTEDKSWYDFCGRPDWVLTDDQTGWTLIYVWNFIAFLIVGCATLCLCCTCCLAPCGWIGIVGHFCGFCATFAAVIITGVLRYSDNGKECAKNEIEYYIDPTDTSSATFKFSDHANLIEGMFITLCIILCCMNVWLLLMMNVSRGIMAVKKLQ